MQTDEELEGNRVADLQPLTDDELSTVRVYAQTGDLFVLESRALILRLLSEHAARGARITELERQLNEVCERVDAHRLAVTRVAELERQLASERSRVTCGWCDEEKFCRLLPADGKWAEDPICLGCYTRVCEIDKVTNAPEWPQLKLWGVHLAELAANDEGKKGP